MCTRPHQILLALTLAVLGLSGCASKGPLGDERIAYGAIGSSDSLGVGAFPLSDGYTFRIQDSLKDQGKIVSLFHLAVPGANTDLVVNTVEAAADKGLSAELITIWVGANDLINGVSTDTFSLELDRLLTATQEDMDAYVVIANLPSLTDLPNFIEEPLPEVTEERVERYNTIIRNQALARNIPVIDLATDGTIEESLVADFDGIHPDDDGHERLAKLFMTAIRPAL